MADALAEAGADLIILEMMSDVEQASRLAEAAKTTGLPLWIGISSSLHADGSVTAWDMHNEEPADRIDADHAHHTPLALSAVIDAMASFEPQVMGIMHSTSAATPHALATLYERWTGPVMAYPEATNLAAIQPADFAAHCRDWVNGGVKIIGGCCGTTIDHIRAMVAPYPTRSVRVRNSARASTRRNRRAEAPRPVSSREPGSCCRRSAPVRLKNRLTNSRSCGAHDGVFRPHR